jgi:hypothetical protein
VPEVLACVSAYICTFERIGRNHYVPPLDVIADHPDEIAFAVYNYARPRLASTDVEVVADLEEMSGTIYVGFHVGGRFTIMERPA